MQYSLAFSNASFSYAPSSMKGIPWIHLRGCKSRLMAMAFMATFPQKKK
jgi:hypothetical protein